MRKLTFSLIWLQLIFSACSYAEEKGKLNSIWTSVSPIEGTILMRLDTSTGPVDAKEFTSNCSVGYNTVTGKNGDKSSFVSILSLPQLKNDIYVIVQDAGILKITTKKTGKQVVHLNLRNLVPSLITER